MLNLRRLRSINFWSVYDIEMRERVGWGDKRRPSPGRCQWMAAGGDGGERATRVQTRHGRAMLTGGYTRARFSARLQLYGLTGGCAHVLLLDGRHATTRSTHHGARSGSLHRVFTHRVCSSCRVEDTVLV